MGLGLRLANLSLRCGALFMTLCLKLQRDIQLDEHSSQYMIMVRMTRFFIGLSVLSFFTLSMAAELPFWRTKTKVLNKITEERAIVVLVKADENSKGPHTLKMQGGGLTRRSATYIFNETQKYEKLTEVSDHVREVKWNASRQELYVHTEAFQYHARMTMKVEPVAAKAGEKISRLNFKVIQGHFTGMEGAFTYEEHKPEATLMGFEAEYKYTVLPMPRFFIEFGLEVVLQKVAGRMRTYLENQPRL